MSTLSDIEAIILDLDGVITSTAKIHAMAWKEMFDTFLAEYSHRTSTPFYPFDQEREYRLYVDGRPRYEGAKNFLESRGIEIPLGTPNDSPGSETVCGLANSKNLIYLSFLNKQGAHVYEDTIDTVKKWRYQHKKTAVISASKNCRMVLTKAGISGLFDIIVDGNDALEHKLKGKPEPDIFLYAAQKLHVNPLKAAIVEDSSAGVKAGKDGGFAYIIGISRNDHADLLREYGSDIVVSSLYDIPNFEKYEKKSTNNITSGVQEIVKSIDIIKQESFLLLLDYDGTLTPIVDRPELAILSQDVKEIIQQLTKVVKVAIISGRDLENVKKLVEIEDLFYAGSHGFEISGPGNMHFELDAAKKTLPELSKVEQDVKRGLIEIKEVLFEKKKFSVAIHYRQVNKQEEIDHIATVVEKIAKRYESLVITNGKKVFEIRPKLNWDKGKAVRWLAGRIFEIDTPVYPLYIGDDLTDEDAFHEIKGWGRSVVVGDHAYESFADVKIKDTEDVFTFLKEFYRILKNNR